MAKPFLPSAAIIALLFSIGATRISAQLAPAPAPAPAPTSDGTTIDQTVAYILMFIALVVTYLIHPMDGASYNLFSS